MSKVTDNVELGFPARMSDGRVITDWRPNCYMNNGLGQNMGSWQYRTHLMRNASQIHSELLNNVKKDTECTNCTGAPVPNFRTEVDCTKQNICYYNILDKGGLGQKTKFN
jgi:hypothetical protein